MMNLSAGVIFALAGILCCAPQLSLAQALGGPPDRPEGMSGPTVNPTTVCKPKMLYFDGDCRSARWFERRFVTPGATFVLMEGSRDPGQANGVNITEIPNARTVVTRAISSTPHPIMKHVTRRYLGDYEVLAELTVTNWIADDGRRHMLTMIEQPDPDVFRTAWWEHTAERYGATWTWGSDLCEDVYGHPLENCGPQYVVASSSTSGAQNNCKTTGTQGGTKAQGTCLIGAAGVTMVVTGVAIIVTVESVGVAAPVAAAGVGATGAFGVATCSVVGSLVASNVELQCDAQPVTVPGNPTPTAIELESASIPGTDPCSELGGQEYTGPPVVVGNSCANVEESGNGEQMISLPVDADDDAAYEVTVYGNPKSCSSGTLITANDHVCVVMNY